MLSVAVQSVINPVKRVPRVVLWGRVRWFLLGNQEAIALLVKGQAQLAAGNVKVLARGAYSLAPVQRVPKAHRVTVILH